MADEGKSRIVLVLVLEIPDKIEDEDDFALRILAVW
jgi:hypothetical protein